MASLLRAHALITKIVEQIHQRRVEIACQRHVVEGRRMRLSCMIADATLNLPDHRLAVHRSQNRGVKRCASGTAKR